MADILSTVRTLVARFSRTPAEKITTASRFAELGGWGSLAALQLLAALESRYAVSLDLPAYLRVATVGQLVEQLRIRLDEAAAEPGEGLRDRG